MLMLEALERQARQWTVDELGRHIQFGSVLEDVIDAAVESYGLFHPDHLADALDTVLTNDDGDDRTTVKVRDVRHALDRAGILGF